MPEELKIAETLALLGLSLLAMASPLTNYYISQRWGRDRYRWVALGIIAPIVSTFILFLMGRPTAGKV